MKSNKLQYFTTVCKDVSSCLRLTAISKYQITVKAQL